MAAHLIRKLAGKTPIWLVKLLGNIWPPYLGAGIKILESTADFRHIKVCLKRSWYNSNYIGTQFGGSIYSMVDPFYLLMLINNLGSKYIVWDKAARIDFKKPGVTALFAEFRIDESLLQEVKLKTENGDRYVFDLPVEIKDDHGQLIAEVVKTLYVKLKKPPSEN